MTTADVQPRIPCGTLYERVDTLPVDVTATAALRTTVGLMKFDTPRASGIPLNLTTSTTSMYRVKVKHAGGDQLDGSRFPIPNKPAVEDHTKDFHLLCWNRGTGEVFEGIGYQPKTGDGFLDRLFGRNVHRFAKAAKYSEHEPWKQLDPSEQSAVVAGTPLSSLLLTPEQLDHAIAVCVPQDHVAGPAIGPTGVASDCDGWVNDPKLGYVRIGQRLRLSRNVDMSKWGETARAIGVCLQRFGMIVVMSGNPDVDLLKFVVLEGAFAGRTGLEGLSSIRGLDLEAV